MLATVTGYTGYIRGTRAGNTHKEDSVTGSIYQRGDGRWVAAIKVNGRKVVRYAASERAARQKLTEMLVSVQAQTFTAPTKLSLAAWVERWMEMQEGQRRPSTLRTYQQTLDPVVKRLGTARLDKLTPAALELTFTELRKKGMGTRRIQQGYAALRTCLGAAVRLGVLAVSPLDRVTKPKHEAQPTKIWTAEETGRFLAVAASARQKHAPLLLLLVCGGLRVSEGLGLTWNDLDAATGALTINKALVYVGTQPSLQPTKSAAGRRTVMLPAPAPAPPTTSFLRHSHPNGRRTHRRISDPSAPTA